MKTANEIFKDYNLNDNLDYLRAMALSVEAQEEKSNAKEDWIDKEARRILTMKRFIKQINTK